MTSPPDVDTLAEHLAERTWSALLDGADTAEKHAAILDARRIARHRGLGRDDTVRTYYRIIDAATYRPLNKLRIGAAEATDLRRIVQAATTGLPAHQLDTPSRLTLYRAGLVTARSRTGNPAAVTDSGSVLTATLAGIAVNRATADTPVELSATEAIALAKIETEPQGQWPGTDRALRIARQWGLIRYEPHTGRLRPSWMPRGYDGLVYVLTPAGHQALERHRMLTAQDQVIPASSQARLLAHLTQHNSGDPPDVPAFVVDQCITRQWVVRAELVAGTRRRRLQLTAAGHAALNRYAKIQHSLETLPRKVLGHDLEPGMLVRLGSRKGSGVSAAYVVVDHTVKIIVHGRNPAWEIWVTDDNTDRAYLYGGRPFYPSTKYDVIDPDV